VKYLYEDVPGYGRHKIVLTRHAQAKAEEQSITDFHVAEALEKGKDTFDTDSTWREHNGLRLVIVKPTPFKGAYLVATMFWIQPQATVK
jgi:hypothetical protein